MICTVPQYTMRCDVRGCGSSVEPYSSLERLEAVATAIGWETQGTQPALHRCYRCVLTQAFPTGWMVPHPQAESQPQIQGPSKT